MTIKIEAASRLNASKSITLHLNDGLNIQQLRVGPDFIVGATARGIPISLSGFMFNTHYNGDKAKKEAFMQAVRSAYDASNGNAAAVLKAVKAVTNLKNWSIA